MSVDAVLTVTRPRRILRHWLQGRRPWWWPQPFRERFALGMA
jgi:hypothetical protein